MRICVCDQHRLFQEVLTTLLEAHEHQVVAQIENPDKAIELVERAHPDLCLVDVEFWDAPAGTLAAVSALSRRVKVVVLARDDEIPEEAARSAGASGWILKTQPGEALLELLEQVHSGGRSTTPSPTAPAAPATWDLSRFLTSREREVLHGLVAGLSTASLAVHLAVRPATIRAHVQSLLTKLGVHSRLEAVAFALENGLVPVPSPMPHLAEVDRRVLNVATPEPPAGSPALLRRSTDRAS